MRGLTLTQPYATLVALLDWNYCKRVETRSWSTSYRGIIAIHAGAGLGLHKKYSVYRACCERPFFAEALRRGGYTAASQLPSGAIVALAQLVDCVSIPAVRTFHQLDTPVGPRGYTLPPYEDTPEYAFGDYSPGRYAWLLADIRPLRTPVPARGLQGLWPVPADVCQAVEAQL